MRLLRPLLTSAALVASALIHAVQAQTPDVTATMRTFDVVSVLQPPPWSAGADIAATSELSRKQGKGADGTDVFIWELIPKGQSFEAWNELFAIMAETPLQGTAEDYRNGVIRLYGDSCDGAQFTAIAEEQQAQLFVLFCPSYQSDPGTGEIAVMHYRMLGGTLVKHYYHKRGAAFSIADKASWPLTRDQMRDLIDRIGAFRITPAE